MRWTTLRNNGIGAFLGCGFLGTWTSQAEAQLFGKRASIIVSAV
jgi:hypothetical protein